MTTYKIEKLSIHYGDSFHQSYRYREIGITSSKSLVEKLEEIRMGRDEENWPECCMKDWPIYKCTKIKPLVILNLKEIEEIKIDYR